MSFFLSLARSQVECNGTRAFQTLGRSSQGAALGLELGGASIRAGSAEGRDAPPPVAACGWLVATVLDTGSRKRERDREGEADWRSQVGPHWHWSLLSGTTLSL